MSKFNVGDFVITKNEDTICPHCGGYLTVVRIKPEGSVSFVCYKCGTKIKYVPVYKNVIN